MNRFTRHINQAIQLAEQNTSRFRLGCVALDRHGNVVVKATNSMDKTHPMQYKYAKKKGRPEAKFLHAECAALIRAKTDVYTLIVVRLLKNGSLANAMPCEICSEAIRIAGVRNVVFSNEFGQVTWEKRW